MPDSILKDTLVAGCSDEGIMRAMELVDRMDIKYRRNLDRRKSLEIYRLHKRACALVTFRAQRLGQLEGAHLLPEHRAGSPITGPKPGAYLP